MRAHSEEMLVNETVTSAAKDWPGGLTAMVISGTVNSAVLTVQTQSGDGTWVTTGVTLAVIGTVSGQVPAGRVRVLVSGATPTALYITLHRIPS
jgi:hypothetical protein